MQQAEGSNIQHIAQFLSHDFLSSRTMYNRGRLCTDGNIGPFGGRRKSMPALWSRSKTKDIRTKISVRLVTRSIEITLADTWTDYLSPYTLIVFE